MCVLGQLEPVDSVLTFPSGYDTLGYSWVKATAVSVRLRISFVTLQSTNSDYKAAILKWQKMEEDLIARGIILATFNWPLRAKYFFYAHGGTLNMEDGSFVTSDAIREAANKLNDVLKAVSEGSFKLDREKDELTYALGTPEHTGRVRGMGVVLWKHGFSGDIETYRSRQRRKAEVVEKMRALEEWIASI